MTRYLFTFFFFLSVYSFLGCSSNDAQTDFERQAYTLAEGITETNFQGDVSGNVDEDDWRTSPFYTGLAEINPVYPNPVPFSSSATLEVFLNGTPFSTVLELGYLDLQNRWNRIQILDDVSDFSFSTMTINPQQFGSNAELARGTYRLILFDGNQRMITYGDITIE